MFFFLSEHTAYSEGEEKRGISASSADLLFRSIADSLPFCPFSSPRHTHAHTQMLSAILFFFFSLSMGFS